MHINVLFCPKGGEKMLGVTGPPERRIQLAGWATNADMHLVPDSDNDKGGRPP